MPCRAGPSDIERGPCYLTLGLRLSCFYSLRDCAAAFKDATAYSVNPNGDSAIEALLFWFTRVGSHLAPGLNEIPEELAFDRHSAHFLYDVEKVCFHDVPRH